MERQGRVAFWGASALFLILMGTAFGEVRTNSREAREHHVFRLENGLRFVVVSDPAATQATVALTVRAGTKDDPAEFPGLTHFVEHIVVGAASPGRSSITGCVAPHGGQANGERRYATTQYHFSAPAGKLGVVLSCVARVFVKPRFKAKDVSREIDVIDAEYRAHWSADPRQVETEALKLGMLPNHPWARAFTGNRASLGDDDERLMSAMAGAWASLYGPERMTLAIVSSQPAHKVSALASRSFGRLASSTRNNPVATLPSPMRETSTLVRYRSTDGSRRLTFGFAVPHPDETYRSKALGYIVSMLEARHDGGLARQLQDRGWIHSLGARVVPTGGSRALATVTFDLTDLGARRVDATGAVFFSFIDDLRRNGIDRARFDEYARIAQLGMAYDEPRTNRDYARTLSYQLARFPPEDVVRGPYAWDRFSPAAIEVVLDAFVPARVLATLSAPTLEAEYCGRWSKIPCRVESVPGGWMDAWVTGVAIEFAQPTVNPYLPRDLALVAPAEPDRITAAGGRMHMTRVVDIAGGVPKATAYLKLTSSRACRMPSDAAHTAILQALLGAGAAEDRAAGQAVGYESEVSVHPDGLLVRTHGYHDRLADYTAALLSSLVDLRIDRPTFDAFRDDLRASVIASRTGHRKAYGALRVEALHSASSRFCSPRGYAAALDDVTLVGFRRWLTAFRESLQVDALCHGNVSFEIAERLGRFVAEHVLVGGDFIEPNAAPLGLDTAVHLPVDFVTDEGGIAIVIPAPDASVESRALYRTLVPLVDQVVGDALRADGSYIAGARLDDVRGVSAIVVVALAPRVGSLDLLERVRTALAEVVNRFDPELFHQLRALAARRAEHQPRGLLRRSDQVWRALQDGLDFRGRDIGDATRGIHDEDFERAYRDLLAAISNRSVIAYMTRANNGAGL